MSEAEKLQKRVDELEAEVARLKSMLLSIQYLPRPTQTVVATSYCTLEVPRFDV